MRKFVAVAVVLGLLIFAVGVIADHMGPTNPPAALLQAKAELAAARMKLADEVIEGKLSLQDAAYAFHALNQRTIQMSEKYINALPGATESERVCHQVLGHVRAALRDHPELLGQEGSASGAQTLLARLEADIEKARDANGQVHLPGID